MRFGRGAIGSISATTCAYPGFPDGIDMIGTKGTARLDDAHLALRLHDGSTDVIDDKDALGGAGADTMAFSHHPHRSLIADFLDAIENDSTPRVTGREALKAHYLIEAMLRSSRAGKAIALSELSRSA